MRASGSGCRAREGPGSGVPARATSTYASAWRRTSHSNGTATTSLTGVDLTMVQAALGTTVTVPTLDGEEEVEFAPGTQPGDVKVLRNKGVHRLNGHGRGDQAITVRRDRTPGSRREAPPVARRFRRRGGRRALRRAPRGSAPQTAQLVHRLMAGTPPRDSGRERGGPLRPSLCSRNVGGRGRGDTHGHPRPFRGGAAGA